MEIKSISAHSVLGERVLNEYMSCYRHCNTYIDHTHIGTIYVDSLLRVNEPASIDKTAGQALWWNLSLGSTLMLKLAAKHCCFSHILKRLLKEACDVASITCINDNFTAIRIRHRINKTSKLLDGELFVT